MPPKNKDVEELLNKLISGTSTSTPDTKPTYYKVTEPTAPTQAPTQTNPDLIGEIAKGGLNTAGYLLRVISGLGRGVTNAVGGQLPYINKTLDELESNKPFLDKIMPILQNEVNRFTAGGTGMLKGVAVSGVPAATEALDKLTGTPTYEFGSDLINTPEFRKLAERTGITDLATEAEQEKVVGTIPLGWFGLNDWNINKREAYGLGWDILSDPTTYLTMGIGGAIKGAGRGISTAAKFQKAGRPANWADVTPKALPRPFYSAEKTRYGRKLDKATPIVSPKYTIGNTSPLTYIVKEAGRGFTESHMRSRLLRGIAISTRSTALRASTEFTDAVAADLAKLGTEQPGPYIEEILSANRERYLAKYTAQLAQQGIKDPEVAAKLAADTSAAINEQAKRIAEKTADWGNTYDSAQAAARISESMALRGKKPFQESAFQIADRNARELKRTVPVLAEKKKTARFNVEHMSDFGRALERTSDPNNIQGDFGQVWASLVRTTDEITLKKALDALVMPIGYRERFARDTADAEAARMTQNKDIVQGIYDLNYIVKAGRKRKPVSDVGVKEEHIKGTKLTRTTWFAKTSKEHKHLMRQIRFAKDLRQGAGSALTAKKKNTIVTEEQISAAPLDFLTNLSKNFYKDVIQAESPNLPEWEQLLSSGKEYYTGIMLENPARITAEVFGKSIPATTLMAARVSYLAEREAVTTTKEFSKLTWWRDKGYNPITAKAEHRKLTSFAFDKTERSAAGQTLAEAIKLMMTASGRIQDKELNRILRKLEVRLDDLYQGGDLVNLGKIEEILHREQIALIVKKRKDFLTKLKVETTGELSAEALVDPTLLDLDVQKMLGEYMTGLENKGVLVTQEELATAIAKLGDAQEAQIAAGEALQKMGYDWMGLGKPGYTVLTKLESPTRKKSVTTESKLLDEVKLAIKGPKEKPTGTVMSSTIFAPIVAKLESILTKPGLTVELKKGIDEILTGPNIGLKNLVDSPIKPETVSAYFSLIGNIIRRMEDRTQRGTLVGFDTVFALKGGEYDQQAVVPFLVEAYKASRLQDSLDNGFFANRMEALLRKQNPDMKPLSRQNSLELAQTFRSIDNWSGEGMSAALLHTMIRSTEKHPQKTKKVALTEAQIADIDRMESELIEDIAKDLVKLQERKYRLEMTYSKTVVDDAGEGMKVVPQESLTIGELQTYKKITEQELLTVDSQEVKQLLTRLYQAADMIAKNTGVDQLGLGKTIAAWRDGAWVQLKSVDELQPGDRISYTVYKNIAMKARKMSKLEGDFLTVAQTTTQLFWRGKAAEESRAAKAIGLSRARYDAYAMLPSFAKTEAMRSTAEKIADPIKAAVNWRARTWLATLINKGDMAIRELESKDSVMTRLQSQMAKNADSLKEEQDYFKTIIRRIQAKLAKEGYRATKTDVSKKTVSELKVGNPMDFLRKVATMEVTNSQQEEQWKEAIDYLINNMSVIGKGSRYKSFAEMVQTFRSAGATVKAGQINKVTGQQVPSEEEVLNILKGFGGNIEARAADMLTRDKIQRRSVIALLDRLDKQITRDELEAARALDFLAATNTAGANQIRATMEAMPSDAEVQQKILTEFTERRIDLHNRGLDYIEFLAVQSLGKSNRQYFLKRADELNITAEDALGRTYDTDKPAYTADRNAAKRTYETTRVLLTGWYDTVNALSEMAKIKGLEADSAERALYMATNMKEVLRFRDLHLHVMGIFPSSTPELTLNEAKILNLGVYTSEEVNKIIKPVYLTDGDILDVFDADMTARMFFVGRSKSMPITSLVPAARFLIAAMDTLPPGVYFNEEQLQLVGNKMADLMRNAAKKTFINKEKTISHYAVNPTAFESKINDIVGYFLDDQIATKLFEQHVTNGSIAMKVYKYEAGKVSKPVIEAVTKLFANPFAATGSKIQAVLDASEALRKLTGREMITPEVELQAYLDLNAVMAAHIDLDSMYIAQNAIRMETAATSAEAEQILAVQRASSKSDYVQQMNHFRLWLDQDRGEIYVNAAALRMLNEGKKVAEVDKDAPMDVFMGENMNGFEIKRALKYTDLWARRLFHSYGMDYLQPFYSVAERKKMDAVTFYEKIGADLNKKWQTRFPDRNILGEAWALIQRAPDDVLDKALEARRTLYQVLANKKKTGERVLTPDEYSQLIEDSRLLEQYIKLDDQDLNEAAIELWALAGRIFGGGEKSMINMDGITPLWLNRNIREIGGGNGRGYISEEGIYTPVKDGYGFTSKASMGTIWREWEITNPLEMIVSMNTALERAHMVPSIADETVKMFGVEKSKFKSLAEAKAEGLINVQTVSNLERGKELLYFMDTENYYYPIQIAQQLGKFSNLITEIKYARENGVLEKLLRKTAGFTNVSKQIMTLWKPANFAQNAEGSAWMNFFAGVNSPFAYARGTKLMQTSGRNIKEIDLSELDNALIQYEAMKGKEGFTIKEVNDPRRSDVVQMTIKGKKVGISYSDIEKLANREGLYVPVSQSREYDLVKEYGDATTIDQTKGVLRKMRAAYDKPTLWISKKAAMRDDWFRAALFMDEMIKGNWNTLEQGAKEAMKKVNRYHPQAQDVATFAQKNIKPIVMFYTWASKALGTVLMDLLEHPNRMLNSVRTQQAFNRSNEETKSDTFGDMTPTGRILPSYYKHNLDPLTYDPEKGLINKFSLANPVTDLLGSAGWLSQIDFNTYQPLPDQIFESSIDTITRFTYQSSPFIIKDLIAPWFGDSTAFQGVPSRDFPDALTRVASSLGLNVANVTAMTLFPSVFKNTKWSNMSEQARWDEFWRVWGNWWTGLKETPIDTLQNRKKGIQEVKDIIKQTQGR